MYSSSTHQLWKITLDKVKSAIRKTIEVGRPRDIIPA
jgi:hypothetical protein